MRQKSSDHPATKDSRPHEAYTRSFPPILAIDQPPALVDTLRAEDKAKTPIYVLGWLVPRNHLWSLKFNGRERHYPAPDFMMGTVKQLFKSRFPTAKAVPQGLSCSSLECIVFLAYNTPGRQWLDQQQAQQQAEIIQFVKDTLQLPNDPKWYRTPFLDNMLPDFHAAWPTAYELEYTMGESALGT
uniref:Uncharacterized protein n=1 Tax=Mycena chlorophos TaxID=658473 RepID=A0ABQ0L3P6_MYCCL|nr:predicted protein [Mycena chlorophos]